GECMSVITLMTDFGIKDGNVGVMKGVIWGICPTAQISDLSHMIGAQNIREAAYVLARSVPYFPKGSIHVVVVDPGVGTQRRPMAAQSGKAGVQILLNWIRLNTGCKISVMYFMGAIFFRRLQPTWQMEFH